MKTKLSLPVVALALVSAAGLCGASPPAAGIRKVEDIAIYRDERFHNAFPSIVRRPDGELLVAFRRAPDRRRLGDEKYTHADPNSYLMLTRSKDGGRTWTAPATFYAHPFGGSQDPCMVQLRDKSILCTSYGWAWMPPTALPKLPQPNSVVLDRFVFLGGYVLRSTDGGSSWQPPIFPAPADPEGRVDIFGQRIAAYNRGALCEGSDGRLYWVVAVSTAAALKRTETHLMISEDKGATWKYRCPVATDAKAQFNETSIYETPKGDLVAFLRTAGLDDHLCIARSTDRGKSFQPWQDAGFQGNPFYAMRLPDGRALLVYGYRHKPFGIRARVLDPECTNAASAPEVVLRDDGGGVDLGYPWATMISRDRALVVYYFNQADGPRTIEGTIVQVE